ncbi:GGDEF domain-containing protein [Veronia pacifica]|uniref:diguanylate cyclase n=1 Tax=Veronia pacifica TaxID=1080227 RepID=A0A1C3EPU1_9GAMM|nr:GGDEF domain-containing protein [Veronia pacifica]ODA35247.1 hypothetical protein A8L45_04870 [Veronia pacifica]
MTIARGSKPRLVHWKLSLYELWSHKNHAQSFNTTRQAYLKGRFQALCVLWAAANLLWIAIDFYQLSSNMGVSEEAIFQLSVLRGCFAVSLLAIAKQVNKTNSLTKIKYALALMVIAANLFYLSTSFVLDFPFDHTHYSFSYAMLPLIHIVVLAIFPLTASESLALLGITLLTQYNVAYLGGHELDNVKKVLYLIEAITALMVAWSQLSQLHMIMKLYRHATLDPLTGVYNRRMLMTQAEQKYRKNKRANKPFSAMLIDLDRFKRVNDVHGHFAGDRVLEAFANTVQNRIRKKDIFGRFGGEEFILFLPDCSAETTEQIAQRIVDAVRDMEVDIGEGVDRLKVTVSIGLHTAMSHDDFSCLLEKADTSLLEAKSSGRDQVRIYSESLPVSTDEAKRPWLEYSS